ncbi:protein chibby homolog 1 isoform X1 [Anoplophora glabripennis]|uniref:protein chibby homolog 1 isoform X1 n=1 Tax=Anoplophora glabripennis TaxID=217634 RepID=UPI000874C302|nr:protein chibby homolog 1 isoform X1 [Anoplophora glabripennis]
MPFFTSKFSPKKAPRRKGADISSGTIEELTSDQRTLHIKISDQKYIFENGDWIPESGRNSVMHKSGQRLKKKMEVLQEENNLLNLKLEILLNMLSNLLCNFFLSNLTMPLDSPPLNWVCVKFHEKIFIANCRSFLKAIMFIVLYTIFCIQVCKVQDI